MKKIMLAAVLIATTFSFAIGRERPTKAANDAAMKAGHQALVVKTAELESSLKANKKTEAEAAAMDILALMRKGVSQTRHDADMQTGAQHDARMKHMLKMEGIVHDYMEYSRNISSNGQKMVETAKTFLNNY